MSLKRTRDVNDPLVSVAVLSLNKTRLVSEPAVRVATLSVANTRFVNEPAFRDAVPSDNPPYVNSAPVVTRLSSPKLIVPPDTSKSNKKGEPGVAVRT